MIIKLTTECPKNGFIIHRAHPETSAEMSHEGRMTQRAFFSVSKHFSTHFVPLGKEHLGSETTNYRTETTWTLSVSPLVHDPSLDEYAVMGLLSYIMTQ